MDTYSVQHLINEFGIDTTLELVDITHPSYDDEPYYRTSSIEY